MMFQLGSRAKRFKRMNELKTGGVVIPSVRSDFPSDFFAVSLKDIPGLAANYSEAMESEASENWCRCEWIVHPDDVNVKTGTCRECGGSPDDVSHRGLPEDFESGQTHRFKGKRMRRGTPSEDCPVHTKEGFLIYFFQWVMDNAK